jgi:hypothetical protein
LRDDYNLLIQRYSVRVFGIAVSRALLVSTALSTKTADRADFLTVRRSVRSARALKIKTLRHVANHSPGADTSLHADLYSLLLLLLDHGRARPGFLAGGAKRWRMPDFDQAQDAS